MPTRLLAAATESAEAHRELPVSPYVFGLVALGVFIALFAVLWAFRSVANKH